MTGLALAALVAVATPAYAYYTETTSAILADPPPCESCHGITSPTTADSGGPHGGYTTTTNKCATCHSVHLAPAGYMLLPAATVKGTCETCHDGTGGKGVYGVVKAFTGAAPASGHAVEVTNMIPGGDPSTGSTATVTFSGASGYLTCSDCHSPHGNNLVEPFTGDRSRVATDVVYTSSRLLKRRPTSATGSVSVYGSDWCGSCHKGRLSGSAVGGNHPVDSSVTTATPFTYQKLAVVASANTSNTVIGSLGRSNFGFVMPDLRRYGSETTRTPAQTGHYPICQQCHEDARSVGNVVEPYQQVDASEVFRVPAVDPASGGPLGNPRFGVFPHESQNAFMLVETPYDNLCLNCHDKTQP